MCIFISAYASINKCTQELASAPFRFQICSSRTALQIRADCDQTPTPVVKWRLIK